MAPNARLGGSQGNYGRLKLATRRISWRGACPHHVHAVAPSSCTWGKCARRTLVVGAQQPPDVLLATLRPLAATTAVPPGGGAHQRALAPPKCALARRNHGPALAGRHPPSRGGAAAWQPPAGQVRWERGWRGACGASFSAHWLSWPPGRPLGACQRSSYVSWQIQQSG